MTLRRLIHPAPWVSRPIESARTMLGRSLRSRVAGDDAATRAERIWGTPGERWFTPDDPVWWVHEDASMFAGGIAALLLQSLHPQAMAGVAGHSGYRGDPWGRLQRTSEYIATTTFGTVEHAEEVIATVRAVHERVRGKDDRGVPYRASDPVLLRWVHVAEIWCFLEAYQRYAVRPLTPQQADRYVAQAAVAARRLGATELPETVAGLEATLAAYRPQLRVTEAARDAADFLLREPPLPRAARFGYGLLAAGALAMLPPWAGEMLGLPASSGPARAVAGRAGRFGVAAVRWGMAGV